VLIISCYITSHPPKQQTFVTSEFLWIKNLGQLSWAALAQDLPRVCNHGTKQKGLTGLKDLLLRNLIHMAIGKKPQLPCHQCLSTGLSVLMTWQLASSLRVSITEESKTEAILASKIWSPKCDTITPQLSNN
jgi:hypothetical protein